MKMRENYEKEELGDFGTGELNEEFIVEQLNKEDYKEMIMTKFKKLQMLTDNGLDKFPANEEREMKQIRIMEGKKNKGGGEENEEENKDKGTEGSDNVIGGEENEA
ncbi:unnamed protein product [Lactuca virosa]|uniref:Uncharacterized protein n=1 Tax=Lactuca virosa TaxID=75947 RepID=A0AAU9MVJ4_9ASTR|nr:unnamed protein product [Lactuca virosa]